MQSCVGIALVTGPPPNQRALPDVWHIKLNTNIKQAEIVAN
jgi:hypothetical protein